MKEKENERKRNRDIEEWRVFGSTQSSPLFMIGGAKAG